MILEMSTKSQRRRALETLPTGLYSSYKGIIARIRECPRESQGKLGMGVLMWLHFAYRPLKLEELQHALAVEKSHTEFDADNIPSQKVLLEYTLGLVLVDEETSTVRFVHYTLEEYLRKYAREGLPNGCSSIAETCLTYLNFGELRQPCASNNSLEEKIIKYPFLNYAARYWGTHIKQESNDGLTELVKTLVDHESGSPPCAMQALFKCESSWDSPIAQKFSGIHAIAYFGLSVYMTYYCGLDGEILELEDDDGKTPLLWAAQYGHEAVVRLLIERDGVDINAKDRDGRTPLSWAVRKGYRAVVRLLIERVGVDINVKDNMDGQTPLSWAARHGYEATVRLLIEKDGVDIDAKDKYRRTPLSLAVEYRHEGIVRLLIEKDGVNIDAKDKYRRTPLSWAARCGHEAIVRLLIERVGVDIDAKDGDGQTPLSLAAEYGHEGVVRLLIERDGVDIDAKGEDGRTPLSWAAEYGHERVVRLLIEKDGDINTKDKNWRTPLSWATNKGHEAVVRLLHDRGTEA